MTQARVGSDERRRSDRPDVSAHSPARRTRQLNSLSAAVFHARLLLSCNCRFRFGEPTPPVVPDERPRLAAEGRSALCPPHPTTKRCLRSDDGRRESTPPSIAAYAEASDTFRLEAHRSCSSPRERFCRRGSPSQSDDASTGPLGAGGRSTVELAGRLTRGGETLQDRALDTVA